MSRPRLRPSQCCLDLAQQRTVSLSLMVFSNDDPLPEGRVRLMPEYAGAKPGCLRASGINAFCDSTKNITGHEKKRTATVPTSTDVERGGVRIYSGPTIFLTTLCLAQRRHNMDSYGLSPPSKHIFGDAHHERRHLRAPEVPPPPASLGLPPCLVYKGPVLVAKDVCSTRKFPGLEEQISRSAAPVPLITGIMASECLLALTAHGCMQERSRGGAREEADYQPECKQCCCDGLGHW